MGRAKARPTARNDDGVNTTRRVRPSESQSGIPRDRFRKISRSRSADGLRIYPMKLSMRKFVQRCVRFSACRALQCMRSQNPCPRSCLCVCEESSTHMHGTGKYIRRIMEPSSTTAMRFFVKCDATSSVQPLPQQGREELTAIAETTSASIKVV